MRNIDKNLVEIIVEVMSCSQLLKIRGGECFDMNCDECKRLSREWLEKEVEE